MSDLPLSVLDLSPVVAGSTGAQALRNTLDLARLTDQLGYVRYWLAEHHNLPSVASSSPEVMIAHVATVTRRMRVGSGGIMLPNHAPLKVAETFRVLAALHPGRIDLGLGRAPGTDTLTAYALRRSREALTAEDFPQQLAELLAFGHRNQFPEGHPFQMITAVPDDAELPPIWLLGSSGYSAQMAGALGVGFAFAHHFAAGDTVEAIEEYKAHFQPSAQLQQPHAIVTASVVCADTDEEAETYAASLDLAWLRRQSGRPSPLPSVEEALNYPFTDAQRAQAKANRYRHIIGSPAAVEAGIRNLARVTGADEVMITTSIHDHAARRHSYELIARAFGLTRAED